MCRSQPRALGMSRGHTTGFRIHRWDSPGDDAVLLTLEVEIISPPDDGLRKRDAAKATLALESMQDLLSRHG